LLHKINSFGYLKVVAQICLSNMREIMRNIKGVVNVDISII
jgi:hypothetical protein